MKIEKITLKHIMALDPCYDPAEIGFTEDLELTPLEFIEQFKDKVKSKRDVIWLLCRKQFMSDRDRRLFAVWCARESLKLVEEPDPRSIEACDVAERFANGEATEKERADAAAAADAAADPYAAAAYTAADAAAAAAYAAAYAADAAADAYAAAYAAAAYADAADAAAQIEQLKTYFNQGYER